MKAGEALSRVNSDFKHELAASDLTQTAKEVALAAWTTTLIKLMMEIINETEPPTK